MKTSLKIALLVVLFGIAISGFTAFSHSRHQRINEALFAAAIANDAATIQSLLNQGADVDTREPQFNSTALSYAAGQGSDTAVEILINHGANINATNSSGSTPLIQAATWGHVSTVRLLLSRGANARIKHNLGRTALQQALAYQTHVIRQKSPQSRIQGYAETVQLLRQAVAK